MASASIDSFLGEIAPFHGLPFELRRQLSSLCVLRSIAAKATIFHEEEESAAGYVIVSGRVALFKTSPNGKELIIELLPAGELFGIVE